MHRHSLLRRASPRVLAAFWVSSMACDTQAFGACLASVEPAILVQVIDSVSGTPAAFGAAGAVTDGGFLDSLQLPGLGIFPPESLAYMQGADERAGLYAVTIAKAGYEPWQQTGVQVRAGVCHVETARLTARLQATP